MSKYNIEMSDKSDKTNAIIAIKRRFLSECTIPEDNAISPRGIHSAPELESRTNYDDICGPWKFDNVPLRGQRNHLSSTLCIPKLIASEDVTYMRRQQDKKLILLFLEKKIDNTPYKDGNQEILIKLLWQTFKFFRDKLFTDQQISTVLELILSTHNFYLGNYWNTAEETYKYFFERILLCTVMNPPKSAEIFTPNEAAIILEFFRETYLENIVLLHLVYMPQYCITIQFDDHQ